MLDSLAKAMTDYVTILEPDRNETDWWAGAPSVLAGPDGMFYLAARMREGQSPRGSRGYETRILKSADGVNFEPICHLKREDAGVSGFERPALLYNEETKKYMLFSCTGVEGGWVILRFDDVDDSADFDATTVRPILDPRQMKDGPCRNVISFKDPFIFRCQGLWHMFMIGHDFVERTWHFVSDDAENWRAADEGPVFENGGWHNFYTRPACFVPLDFGWLFVYEGSNSTWADPSYNVVTGLAFTPDLKNYTDLTPDEPLLVSTTPGMYKTWRYCHWIKVEDEYCIYFEAARPNTTNEIRMARWKPQS